MNEITPITQEEYLKLREKTKKEAKELYEYDLKDGGLTCDDCSQRFTCEFAADLYNTDGDCLMMK